MTHYYVIISKFGVIHLNLAKRFRKSVSSEFQEGYLRSSEVTFKDDFYHLASTDTFRSNSTSNGDQFGFKFNK